MKPTLTAPGPKRLRLKHDQLLSNFAFNFNLRRYIVDSVSVSGHNLLLAPVAIAVLLALVAVSAGVVTYRVMRARQGLTLIPVSAQLELFCPPCNRT